MAVGQPELADVVNLFTGCDPNVGSTSNVNEGNANRENALVRKQQTEQLEAAAHLSTARTFYGITVTR